MISTGLSGTTNVRIEANLIKRDHVNLLIKDGVIYKDTLDN